MTTPDNWKMSDLSGYRFIATDLMLADSAYIKLLSSTGIRIYTPDGKIVGAMRQRAGALRSPAGSCCRSSSAG